MFFEFCSSRVVVANFLFGCIQCGIGHAEASNISSAIPTPAATERSDVGFKTFVLGAKRSEVQKNTKLKCSPHGKLLTPFLEKKTGDSELDALYGQVNAIKARIDRGHEICSARGSETLIGKQIKQISLEFHGQLLKRIEVSVDATGKDEFDLAWAALTKKFGPGAAKLRHRTGFRLNDQAEWNRMFEWKVGGASISLEYLGGDTSRGLLIKYVDEFFVQTMNMERAAISKIENDISELFRKRGEVSRNNRMKDI